MNVLMGLANVRLYSCSQAETRAEFAERSVAKLEKTIDDLEGMNALRWFLQLIKGSFFNRMKQVEPLNCSLLEFVKS